jgi:hypothetical protein
VRTSVLAAAATLGTLTGVLAIAGPASANVRSCGQQPLHPTLPAVLVTTCVESNGDLRRAVSLVSNGAPQQVYLGTFKTLLSYPNYAEASCGPVVVAAGGRTWCATGWVNNVPQPHSTGVAFTMTAGQDANGGWFTKVFTHRAP